MEFGFTPPGTSFYGKPEARPTFFLRRGLRALTHFSTQAKA
ncbi:MAG TPA: hypothetical protein VN310_11850 [Candidatus Dormibacteraeota bacterium]|nr:hypothetical protein [Candidatus Dormibacteraeota bacterium]